MTQYAETNDHDRFTMTLDDFKTCLSKVPLEVEILFAGMAEPWLNPAATEMVLYAHEQGYRVGVYSTLVGLKIGDVSRISQIPFLHFCIHLPDERGMMRHPLSDEYLDVLSACINLIPNHNFSAIGPVHPRVKSVIRREVDDDYHGLLSRAGNLKDRTIPRKSGKLKCSACGPKLDHNVLLPNGDVVLCCCDYSLNHVLGNLLRMKYEDLFESDEYRRVVRGQKDDETIPIICRTCELSAPV